MFTKNSNAFQYSDYISCSSTTANTSDYSCFTVSDSSDRSAVEVKSGLLKKFLRYDLDPNSDLNKYLENTNLSPELLESKYYFLADVATNVIQI